MNIRFLCTADFHIGRSSAGFEDQTALNAFDSIVEISLEERPDALLIAGDFFDSQAAQYSNRRKVANSLSRLKDANIPVLAVAGNHDYDALPTFSRVHPGLIDCFGHSAWEIKVIQGVSIVGRSFEKATSLDLLDSFPVLTKDSVTIGLVHADINARSRYNPSPLTSFSGRGVDAWIVGHVHAPKKWEEPLISYPGSPLALDPGECGIHGFRWLEIVAGNLKVSDVVQLSSVRYENIDVEIGPSDTIDDAVARALTDRRNSRERFFARIHLKRLPGAVQQSPEGRIPLGDDIYEIFRTSDVVPIDLNTESLQSDAQGQASRLLQGLMGVGRPEWQARANSIVDSVESDISVARKMLRLDEREVFECLVGDPRMEAIQAVTSALEKILAEGH